MAKEIDVDFEKLDNYIVKLKSLRFQLEEPSYKSLEFWLGDTYGSGMVSKHMYRFCNSTIEFNDGVYDLITYTINYLTEVKKLKDKDQEIANNL